MVEERIIPPQAALRLLAGGAGLSADQLFILGELRLLRALTALAATAAPGLAGTICQAVIRNPLLEPGLIGINGGPDLAAVLLLVGFPAVSALWLPRAALAAAVVAASGPIGFVGLIAPHLARRLAGGDRRRILPLAGLIGAALLIAADLVGRRLIAPTQIPAGLAVAQTGAPFYGWLSWRPRGHRG